MEYLEAMLACGRQRSRRTMDASSPSAGIHALPRPVQQPHPPIVIGGRSPPAYRRAVTRGNGWYGFALDAADDHDVHRRAARGSDGAARPKELGELEISVTPRGPLDLDTVRRFADAGVHRLVPYWPFPTESALRERIARFADEVIAKS